MSKSSLFSHDILIDISTCLITHNVNYWQKYCWHSSTYNFHHGQYFLGYLRNKKSRVNNLRNPKLNMSWILFILTLNEEEPLNDWCNRISWHSPIWSGSSFWKLRNMRKQILLSFVDINSNIYFVLVIPIDISQNQFFELLN